MRRTAWLGTLLAGTCGLALGAYGEWTDVTVSLLNPAPGDPPPTFAAGAEITLMAEVFDEGRLAQSLQFYTSEWAPIGAGTEIGPSDLHGEWSFPDGSHLSIMRGGETGEMMDYVPPFAAGEQMYMFAGTYGTGANSNRFTGTFTHYLFGVEEPETGAVTVVLALSQVDFSLTATITGGLPLGPQRTLTGGHVAWRYYQRNWTVAGAGEVQLGAGAFNAAAGEVRSTAVPITVTVPWTVADHVFRIQTVSGRTFDDPRTVADDSYEFSVTLTSDATVSHLRIVPPAGSSGSALEADAGTPYSDGPLVNGHFYAEYVYDVDAGRADWECRARYPVASQAQWAADYPHGWYTVELTHGAREVTSTSVYFGQYTGVPLAPVQGADLAQPTAQPVLTAPDPATPTASPVTMVWPACTDPAVTAIGARMEEVRSPMHGPIQRFYAATATSSTPFALTTGVWEAGLIFANGFGIFETVRNADQVPIVVGRFTTAEFNFLVGPVYTISGTVHGAPADGPFVVRATDGPFGSTLASVSLGAPGPYSLTLPTAADRWCISGYADTNGNGAFDTGETLVVYPANPVDNSAAAAVDVDLTFPMTPAILALTPPNGELGLPLNATLVATFNQTIGIDSNATDAHIRVCRASDDTVLVDIPNPDPDNRATVSGADLVVTMLTNLPAGTACYVTIDAGLAVTFDGRPFAGIASPSTWRFTTRQPGTMGAVEWLVRQQQPDGSWGVAGYRTVFKTAAAVLILGELAREQGKSPLDPTYVYHATVMAGYDFILRQYHPTPVYPQPAGNPDSNGNGRGLYFASPGTYSGPPGPTLPTDVTTDFYFPHPNYESSGVLAALAAVGDPTAVIDLPGNPLDGTLYSDVARDVIDYLSWLQADSGSARGGWHYYSVTGEATQTAADQSNSGWTVLGLAYAEAPPPVGLGLPAPDFVRSELEIWAPATQDVYGGSGYTPGGPGNLLRTGNLLHQLAYLGRTAADPGVQAALGFADAVWSDPDVAGAWQGATPLSPPSIHSMYTVMKGMTALGVEQFGAVATDWHADFEAVLLPQQTPEGYWQDGYWAEDDSVLATEWAILTLRVYNPPVTERPDLVVTAADVVPSRSPLTHDIQYTVKNQGNLAVAGNSHSTALRLNANRVEAVPVPVALAPGETYSGAFTADVSWLLLGKISACADDDQQVIELNEGNNVRRLADTDADGLPDAWEQHILDVSTEDGYAGLLDVTPDADFDEDAFTNAQELANGTDPTSAGDDTTPAAFDFLDVTGVPLASNVVSDPVTVSGINVAVPIAVVDGEYSINGGPFVDADGFVAAGEQVRLRVTSASSYLSWALMTVTIGTANDQWSAQTIGDTPSVHAWYTPPAQANEWVQITVDLTPAAFDVDAATFADVLANVGVFRITTEMADGYDEGFLDTVRVGSAPALAADFADDPEGWGSGGDGTLYWLSAGGVPGGHLRLQDWATGDWHYAVAPPTWSGDWRGLTGQPVSFWVKSTSPTYGGFVEIIRGTHPRLIMTSSQYTVAGNDTATLTIALSPPPTEAAQLHVHSEADGGSIAIGSTAPAYPANAASIQVQVSVMPTIGAGEQAVVWAHVDGYEDGRVTLVGTTAASPLVIADAVPGPATGLDTDTAYIDEPVWVCEDSFLDFAVEPAGGTPLYHYTWTVAGTDMANDQPTFRFLPGFDFVRHPATCASPEIQCVVRDTTGARGVAVATWTAVTVEDVNRPPQITLLNVSLSPVDPIDDDDLLCTVDEAEVSDPDPEDAGTLQYAYNWITAEGEPLRRVVSPNATDVFPADDTWAGMSLLCLVEVRDQAGWPSDDFATTDMVFTRPNAGWMFPIDVMNGQLAQLTIGMVPTASDLYDYGLDETAPPPPPAEIGYVGLDAADLPIDLARDIRAEAQAGVWCVNVVTDSLAVELFWDAADLPAGAAWTIRELDVEGEPIPGSLLNMATAHCLPVDAFSTKTFEIRWGIATVGLDLMPGWNLVSLPIEPTNPDVTAIFGSGRSSIIQGSVWAWRGGRYQAVTALLPLEGYWVYAPDQAAAEVTGLPVSPAQIALAVGWNLIGPAARIPAPTDPALLPPFWRWTGQHYAGSTELEILLGYWVYSTQVMPLDVAR